MQVLVVCPFIIIIIIINHTIELLMFSLGGVRPNFQLSNSQRTSEQHSSHRKSVVIEVFPWRLQKCIHMFFLKTVVIWISWERWVRLSHILSKMIKIWNWHPGLDSHSPSVKHNRRFWETIYSAQIPCLNLDSLGGPGEELTLAKKQPSLRRSPTTCGQKQVSFFFLTHNPNPYVVDLNPFSSLLVTKGIPEVDRAGNDKGISGVAGNQEV